MKHIILHDKLEKCNSTNTSTFNTTYEGIVDNPLSTDTYYRKFKNNSLEVQKIVIS